MKPRPYADPQTGKDEPPFKNWRDLMPTMGPDWRSLPSAWWGRDDWAMAEAENQPMNQTLPPPPPDRWLPPGFTLFPGARRRESAGERALRDIRSAKATRALGTLGLR